MLLEAQSAADRFSNFGGREPIFTCKENALTFMVYHDGSMHLDYGPPDAAMPITARSLGEYEEKKVLPYLSLPYITEHGKQVVEVGAGLSEFIPLVAENSPVLPIVIDPLPYASADRLLQSAYANGPNSTKKAIETLRRRIEIFTDPRKVVLYNMTIERALQIYVDELTGCADIVIDCNGPFLYWPTKAIELELRLLHSPNRLNLWVPGTFVD